MFYPTIIYPNNSQMRFVEVTTKRRNPISVIKIQLSEQRRWASIRQIRIKKIKKSRVELWPQQYLSTVYILYSMYGLLYSILNRSRWGREVGVSKKIDTHEIFFAKNLTTGDCFHDFY
jgi:hypothetical protein